MNAKYKAWLGTALVVIAVLVLFKMFPILDVTRFAPTIGTPRAAA